MSRDKYGTDQAPDCYPGSDVLINLLDLQDADDLEEAERYLNEIALQTMDFVQPPYNLDALKRVHHALFCNVYSWAGETRTLAISKGGTRFCSPEFIESETEKEFSKMADAHWFEGYSREKLVSAVAQSYGTLNVAHPFREGNGRTQRYLFECLVFNAGYIINWDLANREEWVNACIASYYGNDVPLAAIFDKCIGSEIMEVDF
ncbi:Fic family protein [Pseudomonas mosselii]|nr:MULTISPECIES: Fic family protein [unclassified Pseudomonas]MCP8634455.1 Fic family protein [Pseudomonas sp. DVZ6]MDD7785209.1 Fic family protein [Pseudomonas sp. DVZ24]